eukprot:768983-Prorocentrum_minimum.AAC.1
MPTSDSASDGSVVRICPRFLRLIGPSCAVGGGGREQTYAAVGNGRVRSRGGGVREQHVGGG